eukprot:CAMPEP_0184535890 /NCGR_PEP_ID=MMETSP0198_2-20121128/16132_1 /TAXON_ID=1112570 /ORGANISM="Thraustochytrium sp., Strain LLF1b" /LENGTH=512 /DNA_ID=CAMNT_0026928965 /DNA_START=112 /DNA_END=1651 /DNA_ORIENTATION=+
MDDEFRAESEQVFVKNEPPEDDMFLNVLLDGQDDFNMMLPPIDESVFAPIGNLDEWIDTDSIQSNEQQVATVPKSNVQVKRATSESSVTSGHHHGDGPPPPRGKSTGITTKGAKTEEDKKLKRREQIAAASRASRARRKHELQDLRVENQKLREERATFLSKINELRSKVENMREEGTSDMKAESALLRTQLEEHKRFVSHFRHLCDGASSTLVARQAIYKEGSDSAQAQVLGLISQSVADKWKEGWIPDNVNIPFQDFHFYYKYKSEYGEKTGEPAPRRRLNVRVDLSFPGTQSCTVSDFMWLSFSNTEVQRRLYQVENLEFTQLVDDAPDKDTKMMYVRERLEAPKKDQDWVVVCKRSAKMLARSTLCKPNENPHTAPPSSSGGFLSRFLGGSREHEEGQGPSKRPRPAISKVACAVLAMSSTQHSVAPHFDNVNRITSMFVQGAVTWDHGGDSRLIIVFSFPEDFKLKAMEGFDDVVCEDGKMGDKFGEVLNEFKEMLGEQASGDSYIL